MKNELSLKHFVRAIGLILALLPVVGSAATPEVNRDINHVYDVIVQSYYDLDSKPLEALYTDDACLMSMSANSKFYKGKGSILKAVDKWFDKVRKRDANIMINFRVVDRQHTGSVVTDSGYYLIRFTPHKETEQPASEFAGKYMFNFKQTKNGEWLLYSDSSTTSKPDLFYTAQSENGLFYSELEQIMTAKTP